MALDWGRDYPFVLYDHSLFALNNNNNHFSFKFFFLHILL